MIFTLGHSTLSATDFIKAARKIQVIIDTRSHPGSHIWPHFNREQMEKWLPVAGIAYEWWPGLGGWTTEHRRHIEAMEEVGVDIRSYFGAFPKQRIAANRKSTKDNDQPEWTNQGLYDYSWFTTLPEFHRSIDELVIRFAGVEQMNCALVCCEALWWKCHRSIIADYLHWRDVQCCHLPCHPPVRQTTPWFKPHASAIGNRLERYDPRIIENWQSWQQRKSINVPRDYQGLGVSQLSKLGGI